MARFVSHTSASQNVDGKGTTGGNNVMERGGSVVANPIWEPAAPQSPHQRFNDPKYANMTGAYGEQTVRDTPFNQHGTTGNVEPASPQPDLAGHNTAPHTKRP